MQSIAISTTSPEIIFKFHRNIKKKTNSYVNIYMNVSNTRKSYNMKRGSSNQLTTEQHV